VVAAEVPGVSANYDGEAPLVGAGQPSALPPSARSDMENGGRAGG